MMGFMKAYIRLACMVMTIVCVGAAWPVSGAQANDKYASIVMDADTGAIIHESNADKVLHPASLTKIMTLLMLFDEINRGRIKPTDPIRISKHAASMVPSKLGLRAGATIPAKDAILALVTKSANDIAVAVAEKVGGTESRFAQLMTERARTIGMNRTNFINASGLHHPRQVTSARDMAKLARYLIRNYPREYKYFSTRNFSYRGNSYHNHNRLMESYDGMDGIKTGYVQASGFNLVASARRGNRRLIGVVFGGRTTYSRNAHMKKLLDDGFKGTPQVRQAEAVMSAPLPKEKPLALAKQHQVPALASAQKWTPMKTNIVPDNRSEMAGQGDRDPSFDVVQRANSLKLQEAVWSIQVGAYQSRDTTDEVLQKAHLQLPPALRQKSQALIAPMKSEKGWVYRAWLTGFTQNDAATACTYFSECLTVAPKVY